MATLAYYKITLVFAILHVSRGQTWIRKPHDVNVTVGSNVRIPCETSGTSQSTIVWNKGTDPIFANGQRGIGVSDRYTIEGNNTLLIRNADMSDASVYTCAIFGFETVRIHLVVTSGSNLTCLSCSAVEGSFACNHSIACLPDESCYSHHYQTDLGQDMFDFGCSTKRSCPSLISKRSADKIDGRHNLCISCCNGTDLCNKYSRCEQEYKGSNRSCLSCNGVSANSSCINEVVCASNEVCFTHHYVTESGDDRYDLGCSHPQSCPSISPLQIIGKRSDGRHSKCYTCCNESDACNQHTRCNNNYEGVQHILQDCASGGWVWTSGVYTIFPYNDNSTSVKAYCERESDGTIWTVIQRRIDESVSFNRNWISYKRGFGNPAGNYWIGNDAIHALTSVGNHQLRVVLSDVNGATKWAQYANCQVDAESDNYRLHVSNYTGNAGDALAYHNGQQFCTPDRDNDSDSGNCAGISYSGWWLKSCSVTNLNARVRPYGSTATWYMEWKNWYLHLGSTNMMIRRVP